MLINTHVLSSAMKPKLLTSVLTISALTAATALTAMDTTVAQTNQGQTSKFVCGTVDGSPATVVNTPQGEVPVILWKYDGFAGYSPEVRCQQISSRFQTYYQNGTLKFLTTGRMNRQNVVCVAQSKGGGCEGLLFTLKPGSDPNETLQALLARQNLSGGPLNETGARVYIDMTEYLQGGVASTTGVESIIDSPDEGASSVNNQPEVNPQPNPQPNPGPLW